MARAKIELLGSASHTGRGRKVIKGRPQFVTNPADIAYYESLPGFKVTMLGDTSKPEKKKPAEPKGDKPKQKTADDSKGKESKPEAPKKKEKDKKTFTAAQLKGYKKPQLVKIADEAGVFLEGTEKKIDMIRAILKAQKK